MARALTLVRMKIAPRERASYLDALRTRRDGLRAAQCNFWVFEDSGEPGSFIEFTEARDAQLLAAARVADGASGAPAPILTEVELT